MLNNTTRNVYIVNNFKSDKIEQAIFILKPNQNNSLMHQTDVANEAQQIINDYILTLEKQKNSRRFNFIPLAIIISVLTMFGLLSYIVMLGIIKI